MINQLEENLEIFNPQEMWKPGYYISLCDFLDKADNRKIYFWVEEEKGLLINYASPPKYYGKYSLQLKILPLNSNLNN